MKGQRGQTEQLKHKQRSDGRDETTAHKLMIPRQIQNTAMENVEQTSSLC